MPNLDRRRLLAGFTAAGACVMLDRPATAASGMPFFKRVGLPVGLQIYTLGDEAGRDLDATFAQVAAIGFRDIEMPQLYGRKPAEVRAAADRTGLAISSLHLTATQMGATPGLTLSSPPSELAEALGELGVKKAVMPIAPFPESFRPQAGRSMQTALGEAFSTVGAAHWQRTAAILNASGAALKPLGIAVGYHNHNIEFAPIGRTNGWEILVEETDPALVHFEVDTGWIATVGLDPADFLRRHRGRVSQLHVKDLAQDNTVNFVLSMKPAEVGSGKLDWARILPAAHAAGVRHFYVEQEPPFTMPRIEAARKSYGFLAQLQA